MHHSFFPSVGGSKSDINDDRIDNIPKSLQPTISPSSYSLLGELGILSSSGSERSFYDSKSPSGSSNNNNNNSGEGNDIGSLNTGLTQDISTLFNIGQHITLCLDLTPSTNTNDIQSLYDDIRFYIENHISEAIEAQHRAIEERRHRERRLQKMAKRRQMKSASQQHYEHSQEQVGCSEEEEVSFHENGKTDPVVPVGSQSISLDIGEDEEVDFDNDIQNSSEDGSKYDGSSESNSSNDVDSESSEEEILDNDLYLNQQEIHAEVTASLTTILQTALNLAVSENKTSLPVFGIWGDYSGDLTKERRSNVDNSSFNWIPSGLERDLLQIGDSFNFKHGDLDDDNMSKILLSSPALSGVCQSESFLSSHRLYSIPKQALPLHLSTLNGLANVLVTQRKPNESDSVVLTAARHCYHWKQQNRSVNQDWRRHTSNKVDIESAVDVYRDTCQQQALVILERASSPSIYKRVPIWGPDGSPLVSITSSVSWGVISSSQSSSPLPPLLQLPLKIRSSNFESTPSELLEMEYALQSAALDPLGMGVVEEEQGGRQEFGPREPIFLASAKFDSDAPCATLSANTRCVLAALLRCGSLGLDTLPGHLTKIVDFSRYAEDDDEGLIDKENSVQQAMESAGVGPVTKRLVDALDWRDIETDLSNADFDRALTEALMRIQAYPAPPAEVFSGAEMSKTSDKRQSPCKGSPPGRLLSVLFAHMARLRTPPSMMRLWLSFVEELRTRWDHNESLPNLGFVPGLDNKGDDQHGQPHWGLQRADTRVLGHRADHAAFVNSSEPDPDRDQCIINQKLQVYNICIECKMSTEALHARQQTTDMNNESSDLHEESMESWGNSGEGQSMLPENNTDSDDDDFFDAEEEVSFDENPDSNQQESNTNTNIERMLKLQASVLNPGHNRVGARCPVPDALPLIESGDQLYAPYLQRTIPMTDEEEQKQKQFLGVSPKERPSIKSRIAIAQRLQKPKLLSDMAAFKSANHGAIFEDFVQWYGNPENPLQEEVNGETARKAIEYRSQLPPDEARTLALEEASEAIAILMSLRAFWEDSWEEAEEVAALNQEPLFDPYTTVEMVLHSFETIHPALLMNQVLAVKLTNAKFVLESDAKPAMKVQSIAQGMKRMSTSINQALEMLTSDAANLSLSRKDMPDDKDPLVYVSTSTITSCEEACNIIGEVEILLSRALSLLQILPHQYTLVDLLLQCKDEQFLFLKHPIERIAFLNGIKEQQMNFGSSASDEARPTMREYVLNNTDRLNPCQLSARLVSSTEEENQSSLLLAITRSQQS